MVSLYIQEQSNKKEIDDLKGQLQSSEALVVDLQKTLQQRDSELETLRPQVSLTIIIHGYNFFS